MLWVDASDSDYMKMDDTTVEKLYDLSGNNNHLVAGNEVTIDNDGWVKGRLDYEGGTSLGQLKTLFIVFRPNVDIDATSEDSSMGLLAFNPASEQSVGVVHGEGIHLGEYIHGQGTYLREVVTAVGGGWGNLATTWRAKNESPVMTADKSYLIVLRNDGGTMSIRLEGTHSQCDLSASCGTKESHMGIPPGDWRTNAMVPINIGSLGLGYAKKKEWTWKHYTIETQMNGYEDDDYGLFTDAGEKQNIAVDEAFNDLTFLQEESLLEWDGNPEIQLHCQENDGCCSNTNYCWGVAWWSPCNYKYHEVASKVTRNTGLGNSFKNAITAAWREFRRRTEIEEGEINILKLQSRVFFPTRILDPSIDEDFNGRIGELLMFKKTLTEGEVESIIGKLKTKWKIEE